MDLHTAKVILAISVPFLLATVWAIVNAAQKDFGSTGAKVTWVLVAGIPFVGVIFYLLFGFRRGKKPADENII